MGLCGCAYYQEQLQQNQTDSLKILEKKGRHPFLKESMNTRELFFKLCHEDIHNDNDNDQCHAQLFSIDFFLKQKEWLKADEKIKKFLTDSSCLALKSAGLLQRSQMLIEKKQFDDASKILKKILQHPQDIFYHEALSQLTLIIQKKDHVFQDLLSWTEIKNFYQFMQAEATDEAIIKAQKHPIFKEFFDGNVQETFKNKPVDYIVLLYENNLSPDFVQGFLKAFEEQVMIKRIDFFNINETNHEIILEALMQSPRTALIAYRLKHPLPQPFTGIAYKSIMIEMPKAFISKKDYTLDFSLPEDLKSLKRKYNVRYPQLVLYDDLHQDIMTHSFLVPIPAVMIDPINYKKQVQALLGMKDNKCFFEQFLDKPIHYVQQPNNLPYEILLLLEDSFARLVYPYLLYWGQEETVILGTERLLSGDIHLDKVLDGMWLLMNPTRTQLTLKHDVSLGSDLMSIINRLRWFELHEGYAYHGELGRYNLKDQHFCKNLSVVKYKSS